MKKPLPEDFGLTEQEYSQLASEYEQLCENINSLPSQKENAIIEFIFLTITTVCLFGLFAWTIGFLIGIVLTKITGFQIIKPCGVIAVIIWIFYSFKSTLNELYTVNRKRKLYQKELSQPKYGKILQYKESLKRYKQMQQYYWKSLRGINFESALANLYKKMGYSVQQTKASGDGGIDLILSKENKKIVVQCKGHKKPIGVAAVRDLYGTMMHSQADSAILACPAGFTKAVLEFITDKPIRLISANELIEMAEGTM